MAHYPYHEYMIRKRTIVRQLIGRIVAVAVVFALANWFAASPILADTTITPSEAAYNVGLAALYGLAVIGILFILSSASTLALIASEEVHKKLARKQ